MTLSSFTPSSNEPSGALPAEASIHRVALMGFGGFEQQALEAYLRIARHRTPSYEPVASVEDASFIVANGERLGVLDMIVTSQRMGDTVLVGDAPRQGTAAWLERPIDPLHLFRALDTAVKRKDLAQTIARTTSHQMSHAEVSHAWTLEAQPSGQTTAVKHHPLSGERLPPDPQFSPRHRLASSHARVLQVVAKRVPPGPGEPLLALIVDGDAEGALAVAKSLQSHGISSERVADSAGAFMALGSQVFDLIVVDVALQDSSVLDGLSLTQALHRQARSPSETCPPIFVTSAQASALEHAQASLAGASSYLSKPLQSRSLQGALAEAELRVASLSSSASAQSA